MTFKDDLYERVDDIYSEDEFLQKVESREKEYGGLLSKEVIAHLIVAEEGRNEEGTKDIAELEPGDEATIEGKVVDLGKLRKFDKNGKEGKVRNVRIDDGTGSIKLVLWDEETEMVGNDIDLNENIEVINGYIQGCIEQSVK